ncbi:MAG: hypothetical protein K8T91_27405 [Planctomycetes bacterium]|nr:hypothetical protein [Planctomycetota bacterium]
MESSNPYQPPAGDVSESTARETDSPEQVEEVGSPRRPWGVYVVAAFMVIAAFALGQWILYRINTWNGPYGGGSDPDLSRVFAVHLAKDIALGVLLIGGAVGLCLRNRWSWWVATFYWGQEILTGVISVVHYEIVTLWPPLLVSLAKLMFHLLLFTYLFHDNVRQHFRWGQLNPWVASAAALVAGSAAMAAWWGIQYLLVLSLG